MECELCGSAANMYCESDEAWLCYKCDVRVHSANFIVANHSRVTLCYQCQSLTPEKASGANLASSLFACSIPTHCKEQQQQQQEHGIDIDADIHIDTDDIHVDEEEESQVVPWILKRPPSPTAICSSIEDGAGTAFCLKKRFRAAAAPISRFSISPRGEGGLLSLQPP